MVKKNKPEIRFKGFTDDWEQRKLGELCDVYDGTHQTPSYKDSGIMFLSVENIKTLRSEKYISEEDFKRDFSIYPEKYDVLMTRIGDIGTANIVESNEPKAYYVSLALLKKKFLDPYFLKESIASEVVKKELWQRTLHIAFPKKINKNEITQITVPYPISKEEQQQIGIFFKYLNNLITLHQRKCEKLKNMKKAMLEKLFPKNGSNIPEVRFRGFTDDWEQRKLGEVAKYRNGKAHENCIDDNGKYIVVNSKFVSTDGKVKKFSNMQNEELFENEIAFVLSDVPNGRAIARTFLIEKSDKYTLNQRIAGITPLNESYPYFLYILMNRHPYFLAFDDGAKQTNLSVSDVMEFEAYYPQYNEQQKIGEYFKKLDNLITLHQRQLEKLKNVKKSMLEKMFV